LSQPWRDSARRLPFAGEATGSGANENREPSSGAVGSSFSPENEHHDLPWF
jgi:hypothetical protein